GGAGPLHAVAIAREISIPRVVIPKLPGNFSALGMLMAEWRHDFVRTLIGELGEIKGADAARAFAELREAGEAALARDHLARRGSALPRAGAHHRYSCCARRGPEQRYQGHAGSVPRAA